MGRGIKVTAEMVEQWKKMDAEGIRRIIIAEQFGVTSACVTQRLGKSEVKKIAGYRKVNKQPKIDAVEKETTA